MSRIDSIPTKLVSHVGFSYGMAELTLKKPPPLVPSSLIASCEATGPAVCATGLGASSVLQDALRHENEPGTIEIGSRR